MNIANSISDLFVRWRSAHNEESNDSLIITKESNISKDSFCEDGLIDDECENVDVLYILKESHIGKRSEKTLIRCKNEFWLKKVYNEKYSYKKTPRRLKKAQEVIFNSRINKMAFMNVNKRGGNESTNPDMLIAYANKYRSYILEEITLLNPKNIVCCDSKGTITEIIMSIIDNDKYIIYKAAHPSYRGIKNSFTDQHFLNSITKVSK